MPSSEPNCLDARRSCAFVLFSSKAIASNLEQIVRRHSGLQLLSAISWQKGAFQLIGEYSPLTLDVRRLLVIEYDRAIRSKW
jgi:hypothetical protein